MDRRVGWGILGCGRIATNAIGPAIGWSSNGKLVAVASRDGAVAAAKAHALGASRGHGSYEALLADRDVDAVYIGLPNGLHEPWALRAAEAGKHVLCEKSLTLGAASARAMAGAFERRRLRLVEAFMYRHHPQWNVVRELLAQDAVGPIRLLRAGLSGRLDPGDHRFSAKLGGGALFDVTCYGVNVARFVLGTEPLRVTALGDARTPEGVDLSTQALLELPGGVLASVWGSLGAARDQGLVITGADGRIEVPRPFIPGWDATEVVLFRGDDRRSLPVGGANHFLHQVEHFASLVLDPRSSAAPAEDGVANVTVCDAIARSYRALGEPVVVAPGIVANGS